MGHEKGKMTKDSRTEVTKVNSPCVISGQYLPTRDDNSLLTRSILLTFEKTTYSDQQIKCFNELKELETKGLSSIVTELMAFRPVVEKEFIQSFAREFDHLKHTLKDSKQAFDERLVRNYTAGILSVTKIIMKQCKIDTGFCYDSLFKQSVEGIAEQTAQITNSEAVSTFWLTVQYMFESIPAQIHDGADFKIQTYAKALKVKNKKDRWENIDFYANPKKLIFFRFSKIHPLYMEAHRKQYGKNGVDLVSLIHYVKHHKAFIGVSQSTRFDTVNTSAYVFDYNMLNLALDSNQSTEDSADDSTRDDHSQEPENELPF
jgi:DNA primase